MRWLRRWEFGSEELVSRPASRPCSVRVRRSSRIVSTVSVGVAFGDVCGRRDRGSNAASPSARYRAISFETHPRDTPYNRAASAWLRPSTVTDKMIDRRFDIDHHHRNTVSDVSRHVFPMCSTHTPHRPQNPRSGRCGRALVVAVSSAIPSTARM